MKNFKQFIFVILFLSVTLIMIEGVFSILGNPINVFKKFSNNQYFERVNSSFLNIYFPNQNITENQIGLRSLFETTKTKLGVVLGGSTAQGFPYLNHWDFSSMLGRILDQILDEPVRIINLAASAQSSYTVADLIQRLDHIKPDFVIVYSGHNEFYGTISVSSSPTSFQRRMYLFLQNSGLMRFLFKLFSLDVKGDETLMERQFGGRLFPLGSYDAEVVSEFIANMSMVEGWCRTNKVPLLVIEPTSNLVDQPPFGNGDLQAKYKDVLIQLNDYLKSQDYENFNKKLAEYQDNREFFTIPLTHYLMGKALLTKQSSAAINYLIQAKDKDFIPFRARSQLINSLNEWAKNIQKENKNFRYLALNQELLLNYGPEIFGYNIFIDHLHFNFTGNYLVAKHAFPLLANLLNLNDQQKERGQIVFKNPVSFKALIPYDPWFAIRAFDRIVALTRNPPFNAMIVPIEISQINPFPMGENFTQEFFNLISKVNPGPGFETDLGGVKVFAEYYLSKNQITKLYELFRSFHAAYPAYPTSWLNLALWHLHYGDKTLVKDYLAMAVGLANELNFETDFQDFVQIVNQTNFQLDSLRLRFRELQQIPRVPSLEEMAFLKERED